MRLIVEHKGPFVAAIIGIHLAAFLAAIALALTVGKAFPWWIGVSIGLAVGVGFGWLAARLMRARSAFLNRQVKIYLDGLIRRDVQ